MRCRVCGCTPDERCEVEVLRSPGRLSDNPALRMIQRAERVRGVKATCLMMIEGVCSRCWRPGMLSQGQRGELDRLRSRFGPDVHVVRADRDGTVHVRIHDHTRLLPLAR